MKVSKKIQKKMHKMANLAAQMSALDREINEYFENRRVIMKVVAKNDVRVLMEDGRYSNFIKGREYRCMEREEEFVLIDEDKMGYSCDKESFQEDFEITSNE